MAAVAKEPHGDVAQWMLSAARYSDNPLAGRMAALRSIAADIGTSPSRLSTYATGKVQPSAAMLLAIERAAV